MLRVPPPDPVEPLPAPSGVFLDADQSMSEMLEALAAAETRLAQQTAELASVREALAESERRRASARAGVPGRFRRLTWK